MPLNRIYRRTPQKVLASFDGSELAEGTGIINYHGYATQSSGAVIAHHLTQSVVYSQPLATRSPEASGAGQSIVQTINFDSLPFKLPRIIGGDAIINLSHSAIGNSGGGVASFLRCRLMNVRNSTETTLASIETERIGTGATTTTKTWCLQATLPSTLFRIGDVFRFKVDMYGGETSGNGGAVGLAHDPQNRDVSASYAVTASANPTKLDLYIPFRID